MANNDESRGVLPVRLRDIDARCALQGALGDDSPGAGIYATSVRAGVAYCVGDDHGQARMARKSALVRRRSMRLGGGEMGDGG